MKKFLITIAIVNSLLWFGLSSIAKSDETKITLPSDEYTTAVIGHVIRNFDKMDHDAVMKAELLRIAHTNAIQMLQVLQTHLPAMLDGVITDMKLKADSEYKCSLTPDYKTNECK